MNHRYTAVATAAVAMCAVAFTVTEAFATLPDPGSGPTTSTAQAPTWPDQGTGYPGSADSRSEYNYPSYDPRYEVVPATAASTSSDDGGADAVRMSASAAGGAAVAFGGMWVYRRRQVRAA